MKAYGRPKSWYCPINTKCRYDTERPDIVCKKLARNESKVIIRKQLEELER